MAEQEPVQASTLSPAELAEKHAVDRNEDGSFVDHVYNPDVKKFHEARGRIDSDYVPPTAEAIERHAEEREAHERLVREGSY